MTPAEYVIVVGCGRLGSRVANFLSRRGKSVVVLDKDESRFQALASDFSGFKIQGDAARISVLKQAKIEKADFIICTTHEDNVNLFVAQVAKKMFNVPLVLARVYDPQKEELYSKLGIRTVCPTDIAADRFLEMLVFSGVEPLENKE
ncbi:MAG: TrkA family potassium uptake protein [Candidatus Glassbacteria bacterium]